MIDQDEIRWLEGVEAAVASIIETQRPDSFAMLLELLPGLPPDAALLALHQLRSRGLFEMEVDGLVSSATNPVNHLEDPIDRVFLRPHPLDFEWRFDRATRLGLASEIGRLAGPGGHVVALGCPTVTYELLKSDPHRRITLIDANPGLPTLSRSPRYRQISMNVFDGAPEDIATADVVVADPPFYPGHIDAFLCAATAVMGLDSLLFLTLPAETTRPTAKADVALAIEGAQSICLEWQEVRPGGVRYLRPRFERLAHEAKGLHGVPDDWRAADLHVFRRIHGAAPVRRLTACNDATWAEVIIGSSRIRVRIDDIAARHPQTSLNLLEQILPSGVLDSVSSRDPRRRLANVWTDGNVVWHTSEPALVLVLFQALSSGDDPYEAARVFSKEAGLGVDPDQLVTAVGDLVERVRLLS